MLATVINRYCSTLGKTTTGSIEMCKNPSAATALVLTLLLSACSDNSAIVSLGGNDTGGGLTPPAPLLQSRAIDRTQLRPVVSIINGPEIPMQRVDGTDRWQGSINVPSGLDYGVRVVWVELVQDGDRMRDLNLATLEDTITVDIVAGGVFSAEANEYDYSADDDQDGVSNFRERQNGSYPFPSEESEPAVVDDPVDTPVDTPVATPVDTPDPTPPIGVPDAGEPDGSSSVDSPIETDAPGTDAPVAEAPVIDSPVDITPEPEPSPIETPPIDLPDIDTPRAQADVLIPRIATGDAPKIDGRNVDRDSDGVWQGDWAIATHFDASGNPLLINQLMVDTGTDESNGAARRFWAAAHDGEYLYLAVLVDDDGARQRDSLQVWNDDSLELYLDADNSKSTSYDANDYLRLFPLTEPGSTRKGIDEGIVKGFYSSQVDIDIDFATGPGRGPDGILRPRYEQDIYELRIGLAAAGIVPGQPFGLELQINDDDDGDEREAKWGWAHPARIDADVDFTFQDPSFMGTALLE